MSTAFKWIQSLDNEDTIRAIMLGESDLPPFGGRSGSREHAFHQVIAAAIDLYRGEFDQAGQILIDREFDRYSFWCAQLAVIWHESETGEPAHAMQRIDVWIEHHRLTCGRLEKVFHPLVALDRKLEIGRAHV